MTNRESHPDPTSWMGLLWLVALSLALVAAGSFFCWWLWASWAKAREMDPWVAVEGTILSSDVRVYQFSEISRPAFFPAIRYRYEFGGSSHVGERIRRIPVRSAHRDKAERWVARYPSGRRVQIYVNPEKPSEAVLKRDSQAALYAIWFPALFVVGGAGMAVAAVRKALRQHRRSPRTPGPAAPKAGET